jgi:hypothetical protein
MVVLELDARAKETVQVKYKPSLTGTDESGKASTDSDPGGGVIRQIRSAGRVKGLGARKGNADPRAGHFVDVRPR